MRLVLNPLKLWTTNKKVVISFKMATCSNLKSRKGFFRVGHSAIWYSSLNKNVSNGDIKILPIFKPSIDFNKNSDFEIHKCHLENSKSSQDFDIINETNLDLDSFNPILQNAVSLSFFDHISKFQQHL